MPEMDHDHGESFQYEGNVHRLGRFEDSIQICTSGTFNWIQGAHQLFGVSSGPSFILTVLGSSEKLPQNGHSAQSIKTISVRVQPSA